MKKGIFIIIFFSLLSMLQVSFFPHFPLAGLVPNLVLISLVVISSFASQTTGVEAAMTGGFFLDLYSSLPFGFWIILSLLIFFVSRHILQSYVRIPQV
ncbi:MAG: rod shape-determining protein MreD [bacterium]|nr:rod shape-determining protein MreD [bacterium]